MMAATGRLRFEPPGTECCIECSSNLFGGSRYVEIRAHLVGIVLKAPDDTSDDPGILRDRYAESFWQCADLHRRKLVFADDPTRELLCAHGPTVPRVGRKLPGRDGAAPHAARATPSTLVAGRYGLSPSA